MTLVGLRIGKWIPIAVLAISLIPTVATACCWEVDVIESPLSCSDGKGCIKQYSTRGCNHNVASDYNCQQFTNTCCNILNYQDAKETTPCGPHCGKTCIKVKSPKASQALLDDKIEFHSDSRTK
jgi:hypothetical protein